VVRQYSIRARFHTAAKRCVDLVLSSDADEIEAFANDTRLDRAYSDRSILTNGLILQRMRNTLQIGGKPFPTVASRCAEGRVAAQNALWNRLNALAPVYSAGPDELESLAAFVRGAGPVEACGLSLSRWWGVCLHLTSTQRRKVGGLRWHSIRHRAP